MLWPYHYRSSTHSFYSQTPLTSRLCKGRWPRVSKQLLASGLDGAVRQRELEVLGEELLDVGAADVLAVVNLDDLEDLYHMLDRSHSRVSKRATYGNRAETGTVTGSHVLVEGINGVYPAYLTELLVHVVGTGARVVTDPDTNVLDLVGALLVDLQKLSDNLAQSLLLGTSSFDIPH